MALSERYSAQITVVRPLLVVIAMKASSRNLALAWVALGVVAGCGGRSPIEPGDGGSNAGQGGRNTGSAGNTGASGSVGGAGGDSGNGGAAPSCFALGEASCKARSDCQPFLCPDCKGGQTFLSCQLAGEGGIECGPCPSPPPCGSLVEASCKTRSDCQAYYCPGCSGQQFVGCGAPGGGVACPAIACVAPLCASLDQASCTARSDCHVESCPNCDGGVGFAGCMAPGDPPVECPAACIGETPCNQLSEAQCTTRGDCAPGYCPNCGGGQRFVGCAAPGTAFTCALGCPVQAPCSTVTTEAVCNARTDCHSVFVDPGTCGCNAVGCCAHFSWCADGAKASCGGMPLCQVVTPHCEAPAFVVSYTGSCYEGCVRPTECGP